MARLARFIVPGVAHHVTQRGNGRQQTFFCEDDYAFYKTLLAKHCRAAGVAVWGWVLMPNHAHLLLVPQTTDSLRAALSQVHRAYAGHVHAREKRTGHFWQGRYGCAAMDEAHLVAASAYVALNPVRAGLVRRARDWRWSSVHAHYAPSPGDGLTETKPILDRVGDFAALLAAGEDAQMSDAIRKSETTGRPVGNSDFMRYVEDRSGRDPRPAKPGRKSKKGNEN